MGLAQVLPFYNEVETPEGSLNSIIADVLLKIKEHLKSIFTFGSRFLTNNL